MSSELNVLQRTVRELMDMNRMNYADLSRASGVPKQTLHNLLSPALADKARMPKPDTINRIARGLRVQPALLVLPMLEAKGYDVGVSGISDRQLWVLAYQVDRLPITQRTAVKAVMHTFVKESAA